MATTTRDRILDAALQLLDDGGPEAMSTRAVSAAAGVQAPAIYRLFRDKQGLLDACTDHRFAQYMAQKSTRTRLADPVDDLRRGWDLHVGFGLAHPHVYAAIYGAPRPGAPSPAVQRSEEFLAGMIRLIARAGRLRLPEHTAVQVVGAAGRGTTLLLISTPDADRDPDLPRITREAVIAAITTDENARPDTEPLVVSARTLHAALPTLDRLTDAEKTLFGEWLDRLTGE